VSAECFEDDWPAAGTARWWWVTRFDGPRGTADTILRLLEQEVISRAKARELLEVAVNARQRLKGIAISGEQSPSAPWDRLNWCDDTCPGDPIAKVHCPCCGADLDITHGDDEGEVSVVGTPECRPEPSPPVMGHGQRVALWGAVNRYMVACGGSESRITDERMNAVVAVERAVEAAMSHGARPDVDTLRDWSCAEFEPSALEVGANPDVGRDCEGNDWYRCRECARWTGDEKPCT